MSKNFFLRLLKGTITYSSIKIRFQHLKTVFCKSLICKKNNIEKKQVTTFQKSFVFGLFLQFISSSSVKIWKSVGRANVKNKYFFKIFVQP